MCARQYSIAEVRDELKRRAVEAGGVRALARRAGIDHAHLHRIIKGENNPGAKTLQFLNFSPEPILSYIRDWRALEKKLGLDPINPTEIET